MQNLKEGHSKPMDLDGKNRGQTGSDVDYSGVSLLKCSDQQH